MINYIHGILNEIDTDLIVVEASGVGYEILVPSTVIGELPPIGTEVRIYTFHLVKEDAQNLYGFLYKEDRDMFKMLLGVNGVGPKGALAILSRLKPDDLRMAIITGDSKSISRAQGVGGKTAERVILDLKDKVANADFAFGLGYQYGKSLYPFSSDSFDNPLSEAMEALTSLGYTRSEAGRILGRLKIDKDMTTEDILKDALKSIRI